jgi:FKBP-type peptidyl-prolyl cis-trans isomerase
MVQGLQDSPLEVPVMRALVGLMLGLVLLFPVAAAAQHKIPPIPEDAAKPVRLPSGVKIIDFKIGTGVPAEKGRMVRIAFIGWVSKSQLMFDFRDPPSPLSFHLGRPDPNVVEGLNQGVVGMRVGGKRRIIVPARLGHGSRGTKLIPPNAELTFDVDLVSVSRPGV